jgi:hypothetical protein
MYQLGEMAPTVVCLSSIFSIDRILLHSSFIETLAKSARPSIWSFAVLEDSFADTNGNTKYFELFSSNNSIPHWLTLCRHFNDYLHDHQGLSVSRQSHWRLRESKNSPFIERLLHAAAKPLSALQAECFIEKRIEAALLRYGQSRSALVRFSEEKPAAVVAMNPFKPAQMGIVAAAKQLDIPTIAYISSWDNITTKTRLVFHYDAYVVWSEQMKSELKEFYPLSRTKPIYVVGAPQYDVFAKPQHHQNRDTFFRNNGLDPQRPLIVYCLGSPNIIREDYGALEFLERINGSGDLSHLQVIVRPHPGFYDNGYTELGKIKSRFADVLIQSPHRHWQKIPFQGQESIDEWVNTLRYSDVIINLASTISADAAVFDKPIVNLDFDPQTGSPNQELVKEINHRWNHFKPVAESGGVWLATSMEEVITAVRTYLRHPELHRDQRKWIVKHVCGMVDGLAGRRMAEAIIDFVKPAQASFAHTGVKDEICLGQPI